MKRQNLVALLLVLAACPVWAQVTTVIADDGTERIVLKSGADEFFQQEYAKTLLPGPDGRVAPVFDAAPCATLGSQSLQIVRSGQVTIEVLVARYNLVNLWLGNVCHGKSDAAPDPAEARKWLLSLQYADFGKGLQLFADSHKMLAQFYLFGAPGFAPDYPSALALLKEEVKGKASFPALCFYYMYEYGLGVPKDAPQAHVWLEKAAAAGNSDAEMLLAQAMELSDQAKAFNSYLELSKSVLPPVWFRLGLMYLEGRGTQKNPCKAQEMFQKAAGHYWSPAPQAKKYLDQIREQKLCTATVAGSLIEAPPTTPLQQSTSSTPCAVKLPADPGELHPKRVDQSQKVIHDPAEYNAYIAALNLTDSRQKAAAMEDFVTRYPKSVVMTDALAQAMAAYQASGNAAKVGEMATRLLVAEPDNLRALAILVFLARDCATRALATGKELSHLAQRGLAALPEWQEAQGASLPDAAKLRDQMAAIFAGAAGWGALQARDYAAARQFYEKALAINPKNVPDIYQLAITDLEMTPMDPNGFWYCGKAISITQLQNKAAAAGMSPFCKAKFKWDGGNLEEWDRLVSNTEKDSAPPADFAKNLSLPGHNQVLQGPQTPVIIAPPFEKGDPMSRLMPATDKGSPAGAGTGSGVVGGTAPNERLGHLPEVISLSTNSLSSDDFHSRYAWYVQHVQKTVAAAWYVPEINNAAGRRCIIAFVIQPDGSPSNVRIEQSSGVPTLDLSAMRAVQRIDSFGPVPTHEKIAVEFWFDSRSKE